MKKIKLSKLNDIVIKEIDEDYFIGFSVTKHTDVNGITYELKDMEEKYYFLTKFGENKIFISETHLLYTLLGEYINNIESNDIYAHGYPESRLIPSNHHEECQKYYLEQIQEDITEKVSDIINQYF